MEERPQSQTWNYNPQAPLAAARGPAAPERKVQQLGSVGTASPVRRSNRVAKVSVVPSGGAKVGTLTGELRDCEGDPIAWGQ